MADILKDYFDALERLKRGKPKNVSQGTKITNDSVSLEAGRKKGTIKIQAYLQRPDRCHQGCRHGRKQAGG